MKGLSVIAGHEGIDRAGVGPPCRSHSVQQHNETHEAVQRHNLISEQKEAVTFLSESSVILVPEFNMLEPIIFCMKLISERLGVVVANG